MSYVITVLPTLPQRASPGCFTVELSTCWRSSLLTGTLCLWPVRWWEPTCCPFTLKRSCTLWRSVCGGSVTTTHAHMHWFTKIITHKLIKLQWDKMNKTMLAALDSSCLFVLLEQEHSFTHRSTQPKCTRAWTSVNTTDTLVPHTNSSVYRHTVKS